MLRTIPHFPPLGRPWARWLVVSVVFVGMHGSANAQLAPFYNNLMNTIQQQLMNQLMAKMGLGVEGAVTQSGAAIQGEVIKGVAAQKAVLEGLESYRQQQKIQLKAQETMEGLQQPTSTCQAMAVQSTIGNLTQTTRGSLVDRQQRVLRPLNGNSNTMAAIDAQHKASNEQTCTTAEAERGICNVNEAHRDLAGADQNIAFLFQGKDGSPTYDGGPDGPHVKAVDGYIQRVVVGTPPEQLRSANYSNSSASRAYVELMRRYSAVLSMSAYSLNQIQAMHVPQIGLGNSTLTADVSLPGFTKGKADISMMEAVKRFIATKFSPGAIQDSAKATSENLILRDMAQMSAFQLWVDQQTLLQDGRIEALMAHRLALRTEQTLRPQLEAQRAIAARAARP